MLSRSFVPGNVTRSTWQPSPARTPRCMRAGGVARCPSPARLMAHFSSAYLDSSPPQEVSHQSVTREGAELEAELSAAQMRLLDAAFRKVGPEAEQTSRDVMAELQTEQRPE